MSLTRGSRGDRIEIEIAVEGADAGSRQVEGLRQQLDRTGSSATGAGGGLASLTRFLGGAGTAFAGVAVAAGGAVAAIVAFGNELERQAGVFNRFNGDIDAARRATNGLVSDLQLMATANQFAARGIRIAGNDLRNVMVAAIERSSASGRDFNEVLGQLVQGISAAEGGAIRDFGLSVETVGERTEDVRRILAALAEQYGNVESSADTAGGKIGVFRTALDNASTAFFEAIDDSADLEENFTDLFNAVSGGTSSFEQAMDKIVRAGRLMGAVVGETITRLTSLLSANARGWRELFAGNFAAAETAFASASLGNMDEFTAGAVRRFRTADAAAQERRSNRVTETSVERGGTRAGTRAAPARRGGGGARREPEDDVAGANQRVLDALRSGGLTDDEIAKYQEAIEAGTSLTEISQQRAADQARLNQLAEEGNRIILSQIDAEKRAREEQMRERMEFEEQLKERARERHEAELEILETQKQKAREAFQRTKADAEGVLTPAISGLTKATSEVIAGSKSADEAFQGLLSSFLEMISQQTALSAAKEFAEAIAAFASYRYDQGAQHLAAGAAFTAVAVAAGAASIAVAPPAGASAPSSPQSTAPTGEQQGGGNVVINWNSPVITAQDRAGLGRELTQMIGAAQTRF